MKVLDERTSAVLRSEMERIKWLNFYNVDDDGGSGYRILYRKLE